MSADGSAEVAEVDVLDEQAVDRYLRYVAGQAGHIDISFDAVGIPGLPILGVPATELDTEAFSLPIRTYTTSYFVTARLAARHMIPNRAGVIMTVTAFPARKGTPLNGGYGAAMAAKEALTRDLSAELAPHGIRVLALRPNGMAETSTMRELFEIRTRASGMTDADGCLLAGHDGDVVRSGGDHRNQARRGSRRAAPARRGLLAARDLRAVADAGSGRRPLRHRPASGAAPGRRGRRAERAGHTDRRPIRCHALDDRSDVRVRRDHARDRGCHRRGGRLDGPGLAGPPPATGVARAGLVRDRPATSRP